MEDQPVKTSDFYWTDQKLPGRFNNPDGFLGYGQKKCNPLYQTSNQVYGSKRPTIHEMPTHFKALSSKFSEEMLRCGMYRDHGFNTTMGKSRVVQPSMETRVNVKPKDAEGQPAQGQPAQGQREGSKK